MKTKTRLDDGVKYVSRNGDWSLEIDEPSSVGRDNLAPSPGVYCLRSLTGCITMAIKNQSIMSNISITAVEVNNDDRGMFDVDGMSSGCKEIRLSTSMNSTALNENISEIVGSALKTDTWFAVFTNRQESSTDPTVTTLQTVEED